MIEVNLKPFVRHNLDILFVGLNPPVQSNENKHYFSGKQSRFFKLLYKSGLITKEVDKSHADEIVFGNNIHNYGNLHYGVIDLVSYQVQTDSSKVKPTIEDVNLLVDNINRYSPKFLCIIHTEVKKALEKYYFQNCKNNLEAGRWGKMIKGCETVLYFNYFPNGNNIRDEIKIEIYRELRKEAIS